MATGKVPTPTRKGVVNADRVDVRAQCDCNGLRSLVRRAAYNLRCAQQSCKETLFLFT